jgi:hypothetical protein
VFDGGLQRQEEGGEGQGRPQLCCDHVRGGAEPHERRHRLLRLQDAASGPFFVSEMHHTWGLEMTQLFDTALCVCVCVSGL